MALKDTQQASQRKVSVVGVLVSISISTLLAAGMGAMFGLNIEEILSRVEPKKTVDNKHQRLETERNAGKSGGVVKNKNRDPKIFVKRLAPIIANLRLPENVWIRLDLSIALSENAHADADTLSSELSNDVLVYVRTLSLNDVEGPLGLANLRQDLLRRSRVRHGNKVLDIFITTLVIQ